MPGSVPRGARKPPAALVLDADVYRLRKLLAALEDLSLAALLRELGIVLYNREIQRWSVLTDVSDELLDRATGAARARLLERALTPPPPRRAAGPT